ncbi:MAG: glycoside hydrolase [Acidobacteriales bacterium 13_1_40CM_3_55_5]|nr:MAG: glycoside hydrolase [Acidobacteriales bacterium 13_1_40CM_3_55_5]
MISIRRFAFCNLLLVIAFVAFGFSQHFDANLFQELHWRLIGPFRGGRGVAISGVPGQPNVFYMAPNNGGVWKTTDYGRTWNPVFDDQPTGSVGALAIAPSNPEIIYVGSGEGLRRPDLSTGDGIYKSSDGGRSWQHLGLRDGQQIAAIVVDPHDPNRVLVAVLGHPYGPNAERGVFRSTDGGLTWQKVLYKDENTGAIDLAFDPSNSQIIYADMWASRRPPWTTGGGYNGPGSGLYKSTDGGTTWRQLAKGLPTWAEGLGRIGLGIAPNDSSRIYALVDSPKLGGLYRSDDAGETWQRINSDDRLWGRGDDFACVRVDPKNKDTIYIANISTYRSTDGGHNFTAIKGAPGGDDYHAVWINPGNPQIIALAVDQGVTISVNGGQTWSSWYNQPTAQFYHVITDNQFPYWVYGGQQESGSVGTASRSDFGEITFRDWYPVGVEEYGYVAPDPLDPNLIYGGKATKFNRLTGQTQDISPVILRTGQYRFNRTAPLMFSPVDPHILYLASNVLFKTTDGGNSWQIISPDLTRQDPGVPPNLGVFVESDSAKGKHRGVIYSLAPSPKDVNLMWAGTDDGLIHVTRDGGTNWANVTPPELTPWSKIAQMDASHFDIATVYAAVNRFRLDNLHPYIYRTHDSGKTWQKIVNGIPDNEPANTVREDPERKGLLFAGTERTVYVSFDDGDHWQSLRLNLPATSIRDLVVHQDDIVVGTHGRSFWILDNITPLRQMDAKVAASDAYLFAPQLTYRVRRNNNTDTPLPPEEPAGQNPPDGAMLDYVLKSAAIGPVTIEISDESGKLVHRFSSTDKPEPMNEKELNIPTYWIRPARVLSTRPGMHRFVWDLHYPPPDSLEHEYPISAIYHDTPRTPLGPTVMPGKYSVKLTVNGTTYTQPLMIKMDPRVMTTQGGLRQQFELETKINEAMRRDYETLQQVRSLRRRLKNLIEKVRQGQLKETVSALESKAAELEGNEGGYGRTFLSTAGGRSLARLNAGLNTLLAAVDSADAAPTTQAVSTFSDLNNALDQQLARWDVIKSRDVPELNLKLKRFGLPRLNPELVTAAGDLSSNHNRAGDDEP